MHKYCSNLNKYQRFKSRKVVIGDIPLGYGYPIRIQSMTTTNTLDIESTVNQAIKIIDAGSDYVRITAPSIKEAKALKEIKRKLVSKNYKAPLIADIHFTPNAAIEAARIVEKVRINPGNYADRKKFKVFEYSDSEYNDELNRIYERFSPLVKVCKENGTAMRIGTNHGSLSDRIMNRYGDTPLGMVESAMEFLRICENHNYYNIVLSMKSSNPIVMVQAYRLLVSKMIEESMNYPLHLGVTEAGEGMEGRIKSSVGIGSLLEDGLGDTIRVSLTEEPELEIPVAKRIVDRYVERDKHDKITNLHVDVLNPFDYSRRKTNSIINIGGDNVPRVILDLTNVKKIDLNVLESCGYIYSHKTDKWIITDLAADYIYIDNQSLFDNMPIQLKVICSYSKWKTYKNEPNIYPILTIDEYLYEDIDDLKFLHLSCNAIIDQSLIDLINRDKNIILLIDTFNNHGLVDQRNLICSLINSKIKAPIIISRCYYDLSLDEIQINASVDVGGLLIDGLGDGLLIYNNSISIDEVNKLSFEILQSTRTRITKTDFISCPSCGRTQFDLMETTAKVRGKTSHLKGLKIAIMGCIVNGPGEMADADYGYVGIGFERISLYKGHDVIKRGVPEKAAVDELINLIKENGDWVEP